MRCWAVVLAVSALAFQVHADVALVQEGRSEFAIYHAAGAPSSVVEAASELQHYIQRATGARLEITTEPADAMISLGENDASRAEGLSAADIPVEGFRIATGAQRIFILGPDTADDARTPGGGTSTGTRNGAYEFLERFVGVRWLMPGEHGDYVPRTDTLVIPETDLSDAPGFENRRVPYTSEKTPEGQQWWHRQRLGWSLFLWHGHSWANRIDGALYDQHPEWFAMNDGVRVQPKGMYKLCVTNHELNRYFAERIIRSFDRNPDATCASISPADGSGWCECPECSALYETGPDGLTSITPAILQQYNEIARIVGEKHPDRLVAGYVYDAYIWPPSQPTGLQPNLFLVLAASNVYCYKLYRPEMRAEWEQIAQGWAALTDQLAYYDIPVKLLDESGAPNPVGRPILKFLFPRLKQLGFRGVYNYGIPAWGQGAPVNYMLAKLSWDPDGDVDAIYEDFFRCAYAEGGEAVQRIYDILDEVMERHFIDEGGARVPDLPMLREVYGPNFPEIERLYRQARAAITDPDARARLEMLGQNLTLLHFTLATARLLEDEGPSIFRASDETILGLLDGSDDSFAVARTKIRVPAADRVKPVHTQPAMIETDRRVEHYKLRGDQHFILRQSAEEPVEVSFVTVDTRGKLVLCYVFNAAEEQTQRALMRTGQPIRIEGRPGDVSHLVIMGGHASYHPIVSGADWAVDGTVHPRGLQFLQRVTPCWTHVPEGAGTVTFGLRTMAPKETAVATIYGPSGTEVAALRTVDVPRDLQAVEGAQAGWWCIEPGPDDPAFFDDVYVGVGEELSGFASLDPAHALIVTPAD